MKIQILCTAALLSVPLTVFAQTPSQSQSTTEGIGYFGASVAIASEYPGSADEEFRALPYLSLNNVKGFDFFGTSLTYRLIEAGTGEGLNKWSLRTGPSLTYQGGRDSDESPNLNGFDDVDGSLPIGGYIRSTVGPVGLGLNVGQDIIGGHGGLTADASIGTFYRKGAFAIQPSASISWADNTHNDSFFSVTADQAADGSRNGIFAALSVSRKFDTTKW